VSDERERCSPDSVAKPELRGRVRLLRWISDPYLEDVAPVYFQTQPDGVIGYTNMPRGAQS